MTNVLAPVQPQSAIKPQTVHALQGMDFQGDRVKQSVTLRLLAILAAAGQLKADLDRTYNNSFQQNLKESHQLSDSVCYNNYWQAATHLAAAFGSIVAGAFASRAGMEATSAVTIVTKLGDGVTSGLRGNETWNSNRSEEHTSEL